MKKLMVLAVALAATAGCSKDKSKQSEPVKQVQPAGQDQPTTPPTPTETKPVTPPPPSGAVIPAGTYEIDPIHSALIFRAKHFGAGYTYGWFRDFGGSFVVDADPAKSTIELTAKVESIDSGAKKRDDHLRSPDFFNAAQFPTLTFKSTKVEPTTGGAARVTGDLTMHGVTKSLTVEVKPVGSGVDPMNATRAGYEATLTLDRMDYGIAFMPDGIGKTIDLIIAFEGVKK